MSEPVFIPNNAPDLIEMEEGENGGLKYRLTVDAEGGPSQDICQGLFYLYDGHTESLHRHGVSETIYVLAGNGHIHLEDRAMALSPGDTVHVPAHALHGFSARAKADLMIHFTFPVPRFSDVTYEYAETSDTE